MSAQPGDWLATLAAAEEATAVDCNALVGPATVSTATSPNSTPRTQVPATRVASPGPDAPRIKRSIGIAVSGAFAVAVAHPPAAKAQDRATPEEPRGPARNRDLHGIECVNSAKSVTRTNWIIIIVLASWLLIVSLDGFALLENLC